MRKIMLLAAALCCTVSVFAQPKLRKDNIDEVLKAMTLEEKATLVVGSGWGSMTAGSMTASDATLVPGAAGTTRAIPRLGIPQTVLADGPAGIRIEPISKGDSQTYYATGFPVGTVLASTWNTDLVKELTTAMGEEVKEYGADVLLAPGQNLHRNPLCGRNFEYFSEDPLLSGKMAAAYVNGIQSNGVGVSAKHFAFNDQETNRMENDAVVNPRAARELYLKGFEIMVKESDPWTIMSSYNKVNGSYTQQNHDLLTTILRGEWGFKGIVMTDWGNKKGTENAVIAGNDLMEPGMDNEIKRVIEGVRSGIIPIQDLDRNVRKLLEYIVRTPRFAGYKYSNKPDLTGHAKLVRAATPEGLVLLENNGVLPLKGVKKVALYGVGSYDFIAGGTGSGNVNKAYVRNVAEGLRENGFEVNEGIENWYKQYIALQKTEMANNSAGGLMAMLGSAVIPEMEVNRSYFEKMEKVSDIAIFTISRNAGEGGDRKAVDGDWTLSGMERRMLQELADVYHVAGKQLVVVLNIGGVIETASWKQIPDAILLAWTPGQEGGYAVADVLSGAANPSGKLPMTFPVNYFDIPSSFNFPYNYSGEMSLNPFGGGSDDDASGLAALFGFGGPRKKANVDETQYKEGIWVGYRYFATAGKKVSYPFGYGLSYTTFAYSQPSVKVAADGTLTATITVKNTGKVAGKEAVQLYVSAPAGGLVKPACELKAFAKTRELKPGESQTLTMKVCAYTLASFNEETSAWETASGNYTAHFGASVADIRATAPFKLAKAQSWPVNRVLLPQEPVQEIAL
ncbi:MAG: glycoside hydrolase family 3 C-terminal domain-containing protein [Bacteroidales bacterium]|nr:glycoside hydrolase family 3 C-terminal domain-containing protein [Bacteroidales bacterium]